MLETRLLRAPARGADSISLGIVEKRSGSAETSGPPILLVHGATFGAALFNLPRAGYSLMAELASTGRTVYALDIPGYGTSAGTREMEQAPLENPPFARAAEIADDIATAVEFILARHSVNALDLAAFSWGTIAAARYAGRYPQKVARLALYAPLYSELNANWLDRIADPCDRTRLAPSFGAYRFVTLADVIGRWDSDLPPGDAALYRDDGIPELLFETLLALDPRSASTAPRAFRCPNGALADMVRVFNGHPLFDPGKLTMRVLLIRGSDDTTSTKSDTLRLLAGIASRDKDYRTIAPGSHFLCIERNRLKLYEELKYFFSND